LKSPSPDILRARYTPMSPSIPDSRRPPRWSVGTALFRPFVPGARLRWRHPFLESKPDILHIPELHMQKFTWKMQMLPADRIGNHAKTKIRGARLTPKHADYGWIVKEAHPAGVWVLNCLTHRRKRSSTTPVVAADGRTRPRVGR